MPWAYIQTKDKFDGSIFAGGRGGLMYGGLTLFSSFFPSKSTKTAFFKLRKMWDMFKVNNKDTRIRKVNDKVKIKDTLDVFLASLLLTLNTFHFLLQCLYCWLWSVNCRLGFLFVVLTLCACWNQFREIFPLWRN